MDWIQSHIPVTRRILRVSKNRECSADLSRRLTRLVLEY
jgi:hypothetical protein